MGVGLDEPCKGLPPGAVYVASFISPDEEAVLVRHLDKGAWSAEIKRRVQHFGCRYDYRARAVSPDACLGPLPECLRAVSGRLVSVGVLSGFPDQVIANEYLPGQGIRAHIDCVPCFGERIVSLSLLSPCEMVFRQKQSGEKLAVLLEPRSVLAMTGPARYQWTHEIPARLSDRVDGAKVERARRISLTFRTVVETTRPVKGAGCAKGRRAAACCMPAKPGVIGRQFPALRTGRRSDRRSGLPFRRSRASGPR